MKNDFGSLKKQLRKCEDYQNSFKQSEQRKINEPDNERRPPFKNRKPPAQQIVIKMQDCTTAQFNNIASIFTLTRARMKLFYRNRFKKMFRLITSSQSLLYIREPTANTNVDLTTKADDNRSITIMYKIFITRSKIHPKILQIKK